MRPIREFLEFVEEGTAKKQTPDISRAKSLMQETGRSYAFVNEIVKTIGITDDNANDIIKLCYDAVMELVRAEMLIEGYNAAGQGAHEAEVSYLRRLKFNEADIQFMDQVRFFRNKITYYGKSLDKEYGESVFTFIKQFYPKLKAIVEYSILKK